jgi:hypothetical protein
MALHSYIIDNINSIKLNLNTIKQRIHDQCWQTQNPNICDSQKLSFFQSVYNMGQRPPCVDVTWYIYHILKCFLKKLYDS